MDTLALATLVEAQSFGPYGDANSWGLSMLWLQALSNVSIGISYVAISSTLTLLVVRAQSLPFRWVYVAFGVFIIMCGLTHFMEVWLIWEPHYWLDSLLRAMTAVASVATAITLPRLLPRAVALVRHAELARKRGIALEATLADLESTYRKARELDEARTNFFANVSHELRTPLTLIIGPLENLLGEGDLSRAQRESLEIVARNAKLLLRHVNDLLDLAKLDAGQLEPTFRNVDVALLVRSTGDYFTPFARTRDVRFELSTPAELVASVDPEKLQRVLINLLSNAFKFTPAGGRIRCTLTVRGPSQEQTGAHMLLTVEDTGPGVPRDQWAMLFERFRQGRPPPSASSGGTGLGLALVREIVALHGGRVWVGDSDEGGALFAVELPLQPAHDGPHATGPVELAPSSVSVLAELAPSHDVGPAPEPPGPRTQPLVLVVEDNADMRALISRILVADYHVAVARDGEEGLHKARTLRPDLILADVMMPKLTGEQLVLAIRASAELAWVPILLVTAKADAELRERILQQGAQDYVLKPFSADELRARVGNFVTIKRARDLLQQALDVREQDVARLSEKLVARTVDLQIALRDAQQASRLKTDFLSLVSHELRTPLSSIRLQLELIRGADPTSKEHHAALERIARASTRLLDLVDSLLELGRLESGRLEVRPSQVNVRAQVHEVLDELRPRADQKGLVLFAEIDDNVASIATDPRLCRLILVNLIENAIKYTERGHICVRVRVRAEGGVTIDVLDTGPGIELELQGRVFEPFEQGEQVRNKHMPGVGLGLSLVRGIARALGGDVRLTSEPGGSAFHVTLPSHRL